MWNGKFDDRATASLIRGDLVWVKAGGNRIAQTALFLGHKEHTVEVQLKPSSTSTHLSPKNVIPWSQGMNPGPWGNRAVPPRSTSEVVSSRTRSSARANRNETGSPRNLHSATARSSFSYISPSPSMGSNSSPRRYMDGLANPGSHQLGKQPATRHASSAKRHLETLDLFESILHYMYEK